MGLMEKLQNVILIILIIILTVFGTFFVIGYFKPGRAELFVDANYPSAIYINGEFKGKTPFDSESIAGEVNLRIIPDVLGKQINPYETKLRLAPGVKTIVRRIFGESENSSSGEIYSFEKVGKGETQMSVVTDPQSMQVYIDGQVKGFTPVVIQKISPGQHILELKSVGFEEKSLTINVFEGFKLVALVKLAKLQGDLLPPSPTPIPSPSPTVEILDTPTGFLRVRSEPNKISEELGQVTPGEKYELLEKSEDGLWIKIKFNDQEGWVSGQYAKASDGPSNSLDRNTAVENPDDH